MPRGACVVEYPGKRGTVWRMIYPDAAGKRVQETLGPEAEAGPGSVRSVLSVRSWPTFPSVATGSPPGGRSRTCAMSSRRSR